MHHRLYPKPKAVFCWSGGKDSALCLHRVLQENQLEICYLLTTVNSYKRVSMHGVREDLLDAQAAAIGIPLLKVYIPEGTNAAYEQCMEEILLRVKAQGVHHVIFGDIFLEDIRQYRERNLEKVNMKAVFPLWGSDTRRLIRDFLQEGFQTITCCVQDTYLNERWVGKIIDEAFIAQLPAAVDPCGEQGEFHTFCFSGPIFKQPLRVAAGPKIYKLLDAAGNTPEKRSYGFWYCDLTLE